jgi:Tfp pilus assembly protein PilO
MIKIEDKNRYKNLLFQFFLIGIIIFSGIWFLRPKISNIFQMRRQINVEKEKLAKLTQKEAFLKSLDEYELTSKTQFLLKILPTEKDAILPLATLRTLVSDYKLKVDSIQVDLGQEESNLNLSSIGFLLKITGNKDDMKDLIEKIKTTYPLMKIEELVISSRTESQPEATIKINAFFLNLPKEIGKTEDPLSLVTPAEEKVYEYVSGFSSPLQEEFILSIPTGKENPFTL